jgi:excisionase family DNA binding protein
MKLALSVAETAAALGVSKVTIHRLIASDKLPSFQVERRRLIKVTDLEAFVEQRKSASGWDKVPA